MRTFGTVLVAGRGEIARRILRTLREEGVRGVAVYSDADADAPHVREADVAVRIGSAPAADSYLNIQAIIDAARESGVEAIHPGYGFLSESAAFAEACVREGIVFIGPSVDALQIMGDKAAAREQVASRGVPVVPGFDAHGLTDEQIVVRAAQIGYPLLVKPSAGGGGKGMEIVADESGLDAAIAAARRVAVAAFDDDSLVIERLIVHARHIEVQVFGDAHGTVLALGERECTLQRRHQKIIEEAPAAWLPDGLRQRLHDAAVAAAQSVDYVGAGTVEFLVDAEEPEAFFFIEMNTRLQVEHPVTEAVTGLDLVALQLAIAAGQPVPTAPQVVGHAVEARVYAESPESGFLPSTGRILRFDAPEQVRVDAAIETGSEVTGFYDPMIAKVIAYGPDRATALAALDEALACTVVLGVETNIDFLRTVLHDERVQRDELDTRLIETLLPLPPAPVSPSMIASARRAVETARPPHASSQAGAVWDSLTDLSARSIAFLTEDGDIVDASEWGDGVSSSLPTARADDGVIWVAEQGVTARLRPLDRRARVMRQVAAQHPIQTASDPEARAPMPGSVVAVHVEGGQRVVEGDPLVSIEAMKMEHPVLAPHAGTVQLHVTSGEQVRRSQLIATVITDRVDEGGS